MAANPIPQITTVSKLPGFASVDSLILWLFERIFPFLNGRLLEIGSGSGKFSSLLLDKQIPLYLSDIDEKYILSLKNKFQNNRACRNLYKLDLTHEDFRNQYFSLLGQFGTVICLNIVDHTTIDTKSIANVKCLLCKGGTLILILPIKTTIYGIEESLQDLNLYNQDQILNIFGGQFGIIKTRYFIIPDNPHTEAIIQRGLMAITIGKLK
jgi:2-polyprenyl-3-methyl-5-hydroxy-6-metoxy-1,4-benzoquinol methylase